MRVVSGTVACAIILSLSGTGVAQTTAPIVIGASSQAVIHSGTEVMLRTTEELTTNGKLLKVGRRFNLETVDPISVNGQVVIPAGSHAVGEVTSVRNKGMWGKSGNIEARAVYVTANGRNIRLTGALNDKGVTGTAGVIGAVAFLPVAGFFLTGTSAKIASGANVRAYLDEDVPVAFAAEAPAPMVVGTSASPSLAATPSTSANVASPH